MTRRARVRSLAKINLDLRVLHKRPDGFHELRTVFQTISLADVLEAEFTAGRRTRVELDSTVDIADNLVARAANLVIEETRATGLYRFTLTKRIPMGAGLGGGSSNAAATLLLLPVLTGKPIPLERLIELGASLGSDVPFFLLGGTALGLGRGTELYPLPEAPARAALVVSPALHVSTPQAYRALGRSLTSELPSSTISSFRSFVWSFDRESVNDFETVVFSEHPQLRSIKRTLLKLGAEPALMSGSGSALFGIFHDPDMRNRALPLLRKKLGDGAVHPIRLVSRGRYRALWRSWLREHIDENTWPPRSRYARHDSIR